MLKGLPASGKSTWAKEQVEASKGKIKRINKDDLRAMIDNGRWSRSNETEILKVRNELIKHYLLNKFDVIIDDTNLSPKHEADLRTIASQHLADFEVKEFNIVPTEAEERDAKRPNGVGSMVIRRMWRETCRPERTGNWKDPIVVLDIDGTIAHIDGNRDIYQEQFVERDRFDSIVYETAKAVARNLNAEIVIVSGRHDSCKEQTERWLKANNVLYKDIFMRRGGDNRKDYIIKNEIHDMLVKKGWEVAVAFDDRQQVCDMWREKGIKVFQVADGKF